MLGDFMASLGLEAKPEAVPNLKGDDARAAFIKQFKEVQRLQTQLDQYTDLTEQEKQAVEEVLPKEQLKGFRGQYLETAQRLREQREKPGGDDEKRTSDEVDQLDFEFVLFASALIDYDYIMGLIARFTREDPKKQKMSREQLIGLIESDAKFLDERDAITEYVRSLEAGKALDETDVREGYQRLKADRDAKEVAEAARKHGLAAEALQAFVERILQPPMIFNAEQLNDLLAPLDLGWRARTEKELALMSDLVPLLKKRAAGREISGLGAYDG
jgi:type I restriction enzyme R subunit